MSLPQSLQCAIQEVIDRTNRSGGYIRAVLLSTTEGVPLGRCFAQYNNTSLHNNNINNNNNNNNTMYHHPMHHHHHPQMNSTGSSSSSMNDNNNHNSGCCEEIFHEDVISSIESIWAPSPKQIPVLGLGRLQQVTSTYEHGTIVQVYQTHMVLTILCGPTSNIGAVRSSAVPSLKRVLEPLSRELANMLRVDPESPSVVVPPPSSSYPQGTTYYQ